MDVEHVIAKAHGVEFIIDYHTGQGKTITLMQPKLLGYKKILSCFLKQTTWEIIGLDRQRMRYNELLLLA